jgi:hypothetical protein
MWLQTWLPLLAVALTAAICFSVTSFIMGQARPQLRRDREAERVRSLAIDHQIESPNTKTITATRLSFLRAVPFPYR